MDQESVIIDFNKVATDIRALSPQAAVPFMAGIIIAGLMHFPDNLQPAIFNIKKNNMGLDNFEVLAVFFGHNDKLRNEFLEQTAQYAESGVAPEGEGYTSWNKKEFDVVIGLLGLTLKQ